MEKTLTRLRSKIESKSRRKLSLPMLVGQFHWNSSSSTATTGGGGGAADDSPSAPVRQLSANSAASATSEDEDDQEPSNARADKPTTTTKTWLGFGKSKTSSSISSPPSTPVTVVTGGSATAVDNKIRRKPRRWPSTPAFMPAGSTRPTVAIVTGSQHHIIGATSSSPSSIDHQHHQQHQLDDVGGVGVSSSRPPPPALQPFIQGYNLTMPDSSSSNRRTITSYHYQHRSIRQQVKANRIVLV